jgi:uncharacterized membrane protein
MNEAHFHLVVNHIPILFPIAGLLVLIGGIIFKSEIVKRMAYFLFVTGAVSAAMAMASGEGAEEMVEHMQGVSHDAIHEHEESAEFFAILSYIFGALSLVGLWASWQRKKFASMLSYATLILGIVVVIFGKQTGTSGGEVKHPEITSGAQAGGQDQQAQEQEESEEEE